jgi:hypothetical protein
MNKNKASYTQLLKKLEKAKLQKRVSLRLRKLSKKALVLKRNIY